MTRSLHRLFSVCLCALSCIFAVACGSTGPFVWVDQVPAAQENSNDVIIRDGDTINVRVFGQDNLSTKEKVRTDGKIVVPAVGEVMVRGKRPMVVAQELQVSLKNILQAPSVTIGVEQNAQMSVSVVGEVKTAGIFQLEPGAGVLTALAAAGGLTDYADNEKIFVVRKGLPQRVRFRFNDLRAGETHAIGFALRPGDVVVVE